MAEKKIELTYTGQALLQGTVNLIGDEAALADDRVFAELLRLMPYNNSTGVARGIVPFGHLTPGANHAALVESNGATGSVLVYPFRAVLGSRTLASTDAKKNWRDVRTGLSVAEGDTTLAKTVTLATNASGNPRWDLVYARVTPDANGPTVTRLVKNPSTGVVTAQSVPDYTYTKVEVLVVTGATSATPVWPAIPSDSGTQYMIPLAYVRVPTGFTGSSTVLAKDIAIIAPVLGLSGAAGVSKFAVANFHHTPTTAQQGAWGSTGTREKTFIPPTIDFSETRLLFLDLRDASSSNWLPPTSTVLDNSRDWRNRFVRWTIIAGPAGSPAQSNMSWLTTDGSGIHVGTSARTGFGATFSGVSPGTDPIIIGLSDTELPAMASSTEIYITADLFTGVLRYHVTGAPLASFMIWLEFTGPFQNY